MAGLCWNRLGRVGVGRNGARILSIPGPRRIICASLVASRRYFFLTLPPLSLSFCAISPPRAGLP